MNRFAHLIDRVGYEPRRNGKIRLIADYFRRTPDPERGWALAALTGALAFRHAKPGLIRGLMDERSDPVLFRYSRDYVGDLSETVALMWRPPVPSLSVGDGSLIARIAMNTNIAAASGAIFALGTVWIIIKKADLSMTMNGALAGLVAITAPCAFVEPWAAIVIGAVGGG